MSGFLRSQRFRVGRPPPVDEGPEPGLFFAAVGQFPPRYFINFCQAPFHRGPFTLVSGNQRWALEIGVQVPGDFDGFGDCFPVMHQNGSGPHGVDAHVPGLVGLEDRGAGHGEFGAPGGPFFREHEADGLGII